MYLSITDESSPTPIQPASSPIDRLTSGFISSIGSGIEDWTQPFERLSGVDKFGDADLSQGILNKDDYEKLPYAVPGGWHPGITPVQAFIESSKYEQDQKSAAYSDAHPVKAFAGSMIGEALNPLWWVGAGELAGAGPIIGRIGGESALGKLTEAGVAQGIQAGGITALEQGANELTGHEADPSSIIKNFAAGMVLGAAAHGIHLALRPQVAAMQDIADSVESGKPLDAASKVFPKLPESAAEEIPSETTVLETPPKTLYRSSQGGDIWTEDIERAKSYPGHLQAINVPADLAESLRTTAGSEASKAAHAAGHQPTTTDFWLGDHPELTKAPAQAGPNTMPVGGHKPVIEAAEQAGKDQQALAEEIAQKPPSPAAAEAVSGEALNRIEQEKASNTSYVMVGKDGRVYPIAQTVDAVDTHPAADQIKVKVQGAFHSLEERGENISRQEVPGILARATGGLTKYREDIAQSSRPPPNTMPVGGHQPVIQAAEQAAKDQQTLAEEIAQKPTKVAPAAGQAGMASPTAAEAAAPQFPAEIQKGYEADMADSNKMKVMADALKQALGCRLNG